MAKPKQRQLVAIPTNKNTTTPRSTDVEEEDSWVMVKKQKVTILIPPLPVTQQSPMPNPEQSLPQARPGKIIDTQPYCPFQTHPQIHLVLEKDKSMSLMPEDANPTAAKDKSVSNHPLPEVSYLPRLDHRLDNGQFDKFRRRKTHGVSRASKRPPIFVGPDVLLTHSIRALSLERKLKRAGGLSRWLVSLGLDQFVKIFKGKTVSKFQLVNLSMKKLKEMGADAVGPRRKLMHAIDCLCQPYCFEAL